MIRKGLPFFSHFSIPNVSGAQSPLLRASARYITKNALSQKCKTITYNVNTSHIQRRFYATNNSNNNNNSNTNNTNNVNNNFQSIRGGFIFPGTHIHPRVEYEGYKEAGSDYADKLMKFGLKMFMLAVSITACFVLYRKQYPRAFYDEVPFVHRKRKMAFPADWELSPAVNRMFTERFEEKFKNGRMLSEDHPISVVYRGVMNRILQANPDLDKYKWKLDIAFDYAPNACSSATGNIVVNLGLMLVVDSEDEMAAVIAHEMAHVYARHLVEQCCTMKYTPVTYDSAGLIPAPLQEMEADTISMILMAKACYDPSKAIDLWQKMHAFDEKFLHTEERLANERLASGGPDNRTHPRTAERNANIHKTLPLATEEYDESECAQGSKFPCILKNGF